MAIVQYFKFYYAYSTRSIWTCVEENVEPENRRNRDTNWCGRHNQLARSCCPINSNDYFGSSSCLYVNGFLSLFQAWNCIAVVLVYTYRNRDIYFWYWKLPSQGRIESNWSERSKMNVIPCTVYWGPERGKGKGSWHQILRSFLFSSAIAFSDSYLNWSWQMGHRLNHVLVNQEKVRNILIIEQSGH